MHEQQFFIHSRCLFFPCRVSKSWDKKLSQRIQDAKRAEDEYKGVEIQMEMTRTRKDLWNICAAPAKQNDWSHRKMGSGRKINHLQFHFYPVVHVFFLLILM